MASWKKVLVSGSAGEFSSVTASVGLRVGNNQTISTTQAVLTGSFTGSFVGDGSGLTGVSSSFPSTEAVSLMPTNRIFVGTGSNNNTPSYITYTNFLTDLAGSNLVVENSDELGLNTTISGLVSVTSTTFTGAGDAGSNNIGFLGTASWAASASQAISSSFSTTASYALNAGGGTLIISASTIGGQGGGSASINLTNALIVSGTLNEIEVSVNDSTRTLQIGLPNNVTIGGNLSVTGTTTTVSASSLIVTDKFIVLSSGSNTRNDGGIIVQSSTLPAATGSGFGFILDGAQNITAPRWGVTSSLSPTANDLTTPDEYMVSAKRASGAPSQAVAPTYGGSTKGYGNIYIDDVTGDIWIYSEQ